MTTFNHEDYPALYQASDQVSNEIQTTYLNLMKLNILLLILASFLSFLGIDSKIMAILSALIFLLTIFINIILGIKNYHDTWYKARSIAESIKTLTWRFITQSEPFNSTIPKVNRDKFIGIINKILHETKGIVEKFDSKYHELPFISEKMKEVISNSLEEKIEIYLACRIKEQKAWYAKKTKYNQKWYKIWFSLMIILQIAAIVLVLTRIAYPDIKYFSAEIISVIIVGILTWMQLKKYRELSASYSFTAHEIGIIESKISNVQNEEELSEFIQDAENAFSREHTQWIARKDN